MKFFQGQVFFGWLLPQNILNQFNNDGDESMKVVNKIISFNKQLDATNGVNLGPKTKEKVDATINNQAPETEGEKLVSLGRKNINNQKANIRVDLDNNKSELETYKKIAEKLADTLSYKILETLGIKPRIEDLIESAREEVENGNKWVGRKDIEGREYGRRKEI